MSTEQISGENNEGCIFLFYEICFIHWAAVAMPPQLFYFVFVAFQIHYSIYRNIQHGTETVLHHLSNM